MKQTPEGAIQRAVCDYLALRAKQTGYLFWRQNTAPTFDVKTNRFRSMPKYSMRGVPDIILIDGGHFIGLEVKAPKGVLSNDQRIFQRLLEAAGGSYHVVRSVDDLVALGL
jgi:hypothetical protein